MNKKITVLIVGAMVSTCFTATTLGFSFSSLLGDAGSHAQSSPTAAQTPTIPPTPPLPPSTLQNCTTFLTTLSSANPSINTLSPSQQNCAVMIAAGSYDSDLEQCFKSNACQHQLSSQPNCSQYLTLWHWMKKTPKEGGQLSPCGNIIPSSNTQSSNTPNNHQQSTTDATPPPPNNTDQAMPPSNTDQAKPPKEKQQKQESVNWF